MVPASTTERQAWQSTPETSFPSDVNKVKIVVAEKSDVEVSKELFGLIPCNSRLRYCVDVGTRNEERFVGDSLIAHSLLVTKDINNVEEREGPESFVDNDHMRGQDAWFGILLQPDESAFANLKRIHDPLGNLCLQMTPSIEDENSSESLGSILKDHASELPLDFDYLGLCEVGYSNYWLLRTFFNDSTYRPKVICISYDNKRPSHLLFVPNRHNEHDLPSLKALIDVMSCYDYRLARTTSRCCFFAPNEIHDKYLSTGIQQPVLDSSRVSQHMKTGDRQQPSPRIVQALNAGSGDRVLSNGQSLESVMNEMIKLKSPTNGMNANPDTLGSKWLSERRRMFESTKFNAVTKEIQELKKLVNDDGIEWNTPKGADHDKSDAREEFLVSTPAPIAHEDMNSEYSNENRQTESSDILDAIRSTNVMSSQHISSPDPVGETISQKMIENQTLTQDLPTIAKPQESPQDFVKDTLLELKQEMARFSQGIEDEEVGEYETDEIDDDYLHESFPLDLTAICDTVERNNTQERSQCAKTLMSELQQNGHVKVCGTSVSRFVCRDALYASHLLLCEADESTRASCRSQKECLRGYAPKCTERSDSSGLTDMVRKFRLGSKEGAYRNMWPVGKSLDEETEEYIRSSLEEYHDGLHRLASAITKSLLETLSSETKVFETNETIRSPLFVENDPNAPLLTVFNCERGSRHDTKKPLVTNHDDESLLTILLLDGGDCAHVQHEVAEGKWETVQLPSVVPMDPVFMVYAGKTLRKLSTDRLPSNARQIVPSSGEQNVNGLLFSLMPSDANAKFTVREEPTNTNLEDLSNPISKLAAELKSIDEMFQSVVFAEDEDFEYESDCVNYFEEDFHYSMDPFEQELEGARDFRKSHIDSQRAGSRKSRASYPFDGDDSELSRFRNRSSSRRASYGGRAVTDGDESTIYSLRRERYQPKRTDRSPQLLGSPILPIVIESSNATKSRNIVHIDEGLEPISVPPTKPQIDPKCFLPVAKPSFKPEPRATCKPRSSTSQASQATGKGSVKPGILYASNYTSRKYGESSEHTRNSNSSGNMSKDDERDERHDERVQNMLSFLEEHSVDSSDASIVLDVLLSDSKEKQKMSQQHQIRHAPSKGSYNSIKNAPSQPRPRNSVIAAPSKSDVLNAPSRKCDPIFKEWMERILTEQSMLKTCNEVQQSLPHPPSLTSNNNLYNQLPPRNDGKYRSQVERRMRENAKKIRRSSQKWEERGYRFGRDSVKQGNE